MMNIAFCINRKFIQQLCTTIISILENNNCNITVYILHSELVKKDILNIELLKLKYNNLEIKFIKVDKKNFRNLKNNLKHISIETYFRYAIAELIKEEKCLYLDADIIVCGNLESLYNEDIKDYYCAGIKDLYIEYLNYKEKIEFKINELYINAGVLLLNLNKMREDNIYQKLLKNTELYKDKIEYQDQDIINITFRNKILEVDSIYNFTTKNIEDEINKSERAIIIHFTGPNKPWDFKFKKKYYKKLYQSYNTIFKRLILKNKGVFEWLKFQL